MIQRLPVVLAAIALIAGSFGIARASIWSVTVVNDTPTCAVVTVWQQIDNGSFVILDGYSVRHVRSKAEIEVPTFGNPRTSITAVRVRAEIKSTMDCSGPSVYELDQREHAVRTAAEYTEAALFKTRGGYRIRFMAK